MSICLFIAFVFRITICGLIKTLKYNWWSSLAKGHLSICIANVLTICSFSRITCLWKRERILLIACYPDSVKVSLHPGQKYHNIATQWELSTSHPSSDQMSDASDGCTHTTGCPKILFISWFYLFAMTKRLLCIYTQENSFRRGESL